MCLGVPSNCYCNMEYEDPIGLSRTRIKMPSMCLSAFF